MELSILRKSNSLGWRALALVGAVLTQLLLATGGVQSSSLVSSSEVLIAPRTAEVRGSANHCGRDPLDARNSLAACFPHGFLNVASVSAERTVRQVLVDIDHDGDADLVALTNLPRLLVWLNDGRGHFTSCHSSSSLRCPRTLDDPDSNDEDSPLLFLWLDSRVFSLRLIPLAATQSDLDSAPAFLDCLAQSSPRAPPPQIS